MNHILKRAAVALLAAPALAVALAACNGSSTSSGSTEQEIATALASNQALHQPLTSVEKQGEHRLEKCLPNGKSVVPVLMSGKASVQNAVQVAEAFQGDNLKATLDKCLPGDKNHPVKHAIEQFQKCMEAQGKTALEKAVKAADAPYENHPVRDRHLIVAATSMATSQVTVRTAAQCFSSLR